MTISKEKYEQLSDKINRYDAARNELFPPNKSGWIVYPVSEINRILEKAGLEESPNNLERGDVEEYEFIRDKPDRYFAYVSNDEKYVQTSAGNILGTIYKLGRLQRRSDTDWRKSIRVAGINGVLYVGTYQCGCGTYCRLRRKKEGL